MATEFNPDQVWQELLWAFARREWNTAVGKAQVLLYWLEHGGTPPNLAGDIPVANLLNWSLARTGCELILAQASENGAYTPPPQPSSRKRTWS